MKGDVPLVALIGLILLVVALAGVGLFASGFSATVAGDASGAGSVSTGLGLIIAVAFIIAIFAAFGIKLKLGG
jgi:hypothetical protein